MGTEEYVEWARRAKVRTVEHGIITPIGFRVAEVVQAGWVERPTVEWVRRLIFSGRVFSSAVVEVEQVTRGVVETGAMVVAVVERTVPRPGVTD